MSPIKTFLFNSSFNFTWKIFSVHLDLSSSIFFSTRFFFEQSILDFPLAVKIFQTNDVALLLKIFLLFPFSQIFMNQSENVLEDFRLITKFNSYFEQICSGTILSNYWLNKLNKKTFFVIF